MYQPLLICPNCGDLILDGKWCISCGYEVSEADDIRSKATDEVPEKNE